MRKFAILFALAGAAIFPLKTWAAPADTHKLTLEDLLPTEALGDAVVSPDGKTIAITRGLQIDLIPAEGGWPVTLTTSQGGKSGVSWSPDSRTIAYASQGSIWSVSVATGEPKRLTKSLSRERRRSPPGRGPGAAVFAEGSLDSLSDRTPRA